MPELIAVSREATQSLSNTPDRKPRVSVTKALNLLFFVLALTACSGLEPTPIPTVTATETPTPLPTATATLIPSPTLDYVDGGQFENQATSDAIYLHNVATRAARWEATRAVEPYGSDEWREKLATFPAWYRDGVMGMTGSTTTWKPDGLWVYAYQCNGGVVDKVLVKGPDGGTYFAISSVTNQHCSFEEFDEHNSSPLRLSLRGVHSGFSEAVGTFVGSTVLTDSSGVDSIDMAVTTVLTSVNDVTKQLIPMGRDKFVPGSQIDEPMDQSIRGIGIPWSNNHAFNFFDGFLGDLVGPYFFTYDINSVPGLSGTLSLIENDGLPVVPGLVRGTESNAANLSYIVANPDDIQAQLKSAHDEHMALLASQGYVLTP